MDETQAYSLDLTRSKYMNMVKPLDFTFHFTCLYHSIGPHLGKTVPFVVEGLMFTMDKRINKATKCNLSSGTKNVLLL